MSLRMPSRGTRCRALAACLFVPFLSGCSGGDSTPVSPTPPASPTASSVSVTVTSPIRVGETAQATATATLSNGQSSAVTTGWQSDNASVATVSASGVVTGVANGQAGIVVSSGGVQGRQTIRVVPDYQGSWQGAIVQTRCAEPNEWRLIDFCALNPANSRYAYTLAIQQNGTSLTVTPDYFSDADLPAAPASVRDDGSTVVSSTFRDADTNLSVETVWTINSPSRGQLTGTVAEIWRIPGIASEGRVEYDIASGTRISTTAATTRGVATRSLRTLRRTILAPRQ